MSVMLLPEVESLLAMTGETLDNELLDAVRELREVCAEHDAVSLRFEAAGAKVKRLLEGKLR